MLNYLKKLKKFFFRKKIFFLIFSLFLGLSFLFPQITLANTSVDLGAEYGEQIGLSSADPRIMAARLVQVVLGFLGILVVGLIMYGGFLWMTSAGNPEKVEKAKKTIRNAIIGLIIILASFGITTFILNKLVDAFGSGQSTGPRSSSPVYGLGALGNCSVQDVYPAPQQKDVPRNTAIMITFNEEVDPSSVCQSLNGSGECQGSNIHSDGRIRIYKARDGFGDDNYMENVQVYQTSDNKTFVFQPGSYLGSASEYVWYAVYLSNDVLNMEGEGIFSHCRSDFFEWQFEVSNRLDLTPPQVRRVFPPPDNEQDEISVVASLEHATGEITLNNNPNTYEPAEFNSVTSGPDSSSDVEVVVDNNSNQGGDLRLAIQSDGITASLENITTGNSLGVAQFQGSTVNFSGILSFIVNDSYNPGNFWTISVTARQAAHSLTVNSDVYTFVSSGGTVLPNQIIVNEGSVAGTVSNIADKLNSRSDLTALANGNTIELEASLGGSKGNNILIGGDNDFIIIGMSGGQDANEIVQVNDRRDQPKNAIVQVNFNEAVSPLTLSGSTDEVSSVIRVVNNDNSASGQGATCSNDSDCTSLNCDNTSNQCVGNYLPGRFLMSNNYRTVEFQSDNKCGVNACGEDVYCLPGEANIRVELVAASLMNCTNDLDCAPRSPFNTCASVSGGIYGQSCVNEENLNYPMAHLPLDGVADAANNSLDGNRDEEAEGPVDYFNENNGDQAFGDNFVWSFWTSDEIRIGAPVIEETTPNSGGATNNLTEPIGIIFNSLMQSSSLKSGETIIDTGNNQVNHKLINLWNFVGRAVGYWITNEGIEDEAPFDGYPNKTQAFINHSIFSEAIDYRAQVGSGVRDIYQNCYKPSDGPACTNISDTNPSCCDGTAVSAPSCN